jgi:hypothetical protein
MNRLNIHQKVSLIAQGQKSKMTKEVVGDPKETQYENEIKPALTEEKKEEIKKYSEKLTNLGNYRECDVYNLMKKYDFVTVVIDDVINVLLKKKEEALTVSSDEWHTVKGGKKFEEQLKKDAKEDKSQKLPQEKDEHEEGDKAYQKSFGRNKRNYQNNDYNDQYYHQYDQSGYQYDEYYDQKGYNQKGYNQQGYGKYQNYDPYYEGAGGYKNTRYNNNNQYQKKRRGDDYDDLEKELELINYEVPGHLQPHQKKNPYHHPPQNVVQYVKKDSAGHEEQTKPQEDTQHKQKQNKNKGQNNKNARGRQQFQEKVYYVKKGENNQEGSGERGSDNVIKRYDENSIQEFFRDSNAGSPAQDKKRPLEEKSNDHTAQPPESKPVKTESNIPTTQATQKPHIASPTPTLPPNLPNTANTAPHNTSPPQNHYNKTSDLNNNKPVGIDPKTANSNPNMYNYNQGYGYQNHYLNTFNTGYNAPIGQSRQASGKSPTKDILGNPIEENRGPQFNYPTPFMMPPVQTGGKDSTGSKDAQPHPQPQLMNMPYLVIPQANGSTIVQYMMPPGFQPYGPILTAPTNPTPYSQTSQPVYRPQDFGFPYPSNPIEPTAHTEDASKKGTTQQSQQKPQQLHGYTPYGQQDTRVNSYKKL